MVRQINDKFLFFDEMEINLLKKVLTTKKLSGTSEWVELYEKKLCDYFGVKFAIALSSGSAALHTALYVVGATDGAEVLVPATAPIPTVIPILIARARPVFVDVLPETFAFECNDLKRKITSKTKAAIIIPMWGYPLPYKDTLEVLEEWGIPLIEDTAQAHGTIIDEKKAGAWGLISCFSTHDRKLLATGEGGFALTNNKEIYDKAKLFSQFGYMDGIHFGYNYKPQTLQCALGLYRLDHIDKQIRIRTDKATSLLESIRNDYICELAIPPQSSPNYYSLVIRLKASSEKVRKFISFLANSNIPSDIFKYGYRPIYKHPLFREFYNLECHNAENLVKTITTLPVHPDISNDDIEYIVNIIKKAEKILF